MLLAALAQSLLRVVHCVSHSASPGGGAPIVTGPALMSRGPLQTYLGRDVAKLNLGHCFHTA